MAQKSIPLFPGGTDPFCIGPETDHYGDTMSFSSEDDENPTVDLQNSTPALNLPYSSDPDPYASALIKYTLIAPAIQHTHFEESNAAYFKKVSQIPVMFPDGSQKKFAVSTLQTWLYQYRKEGLTGLVNKSRSDKGTSRVLLIEAIEKIVELKEQYPRLPCTGIHQKLLNEGYISADISVRTIQRFIKNHNMKNQVITVSKDRKAYESEAFGCIWQSDTCYTDYITEDGIERRTYLIIVIDDHSRMLLAGEFFYADNSENFQKVLKRAIEIYGIPDILYTDHGGPYENGQLEAITAELGIMHRLAPVRDGAAKGKVERTFGTIKRRWLYGLDIEGINSLKELNEVFRQYIRTHNTTVNRSTRERPIDRYQRTLNHIRSIKSKDWLNECFMNRITRKVRRDATVSINSVLYDVPQQFQRTTVEIRYEPSDTEFDNAYIWFEKKKYPIHRTDKVANSRKHRRTTEENLKFSYANTEFNN